MSEEVIINGRRYRRSIFWIQAQNAYIKAVFFGAEALCHRTQGEYLSATIFCYYSLFHFSVALMFSCPQYISQSLLERLLRNRREGAADPTSSIRHRDIPAFLRRCETLSLSPQLRESFQLARDLREFVNYGPRIAWVNGRPFFHTCQRRCNELDDLLDQLENLFNAVIDWASRHSALGGDLTPLITGIQKEFFEEQDFLYAEWCCPAVIQTARELAKKLCRVGLGN